MKYLQASTTVRGAFVLLSSVALLSLASCGGGGGGGKGGGGGSPDLPGFILPIASLAISAGTSTLVPLWRAKPWCWGNNSNGELGNPDSSSNLPVAVVQTPADADAGTDAVLLDSGLLASQQGGFTLVPLWMAPPSAGGITRMDSWVTAAALTAVLPCRSQGW